MITVQIRTPAGEDQTVQLAAARDLVIGRDRSCDLVLPADEVSREHTVLRCQNSSLVVTDRSSNGTWVGNQLVHQTSITVPFGQPLRVGPYTLMVTNGQASANNPGPPSSAPSSVPPQSPAGQGASPARPQSYAVSGTSGRPTKRPPPLPSRARDILHQELAKAPTRAPRSSKYGNSGTAAVGRDLRRRIHRRLVDHLDLHNLNREGMDMTSMRPKVRKALASILRQHMHELPDGTDLETLIEEMTHGVLGLGPLEVLLADETVSEIMAVDPETIFIERLGRIEETDLRFTDDEALRAVIERILTPLGRRIDESNPLVDARLNDGSRVNAIIRPLALRGACITIRKFRKNPLSLEELITSGGLNESMARLLVRSVIVRKNIVVSGGTGSGKTTLLNVLSAAIPSDERIVTIEDVAELRLAQPHVVSLESRPPNMEGNGEISIRDLVHNALRMRPDRIVVGECRGGEALDMLQAMNSGHEGSMTATHANSPAEALKRLETLALMSGVDLPSRALREQIASSIHLVVQQRRYGDGSRRIEAISEVVGIDEEGNLELHDIFVFRRKSTSAAGDITGQHYATGYLPSFIDEFMTHGLLESGDNLW
jgi:pilus assembly protein CpaF